MPNQQYELCPKCIINLLSKRAIKPSEKKSSTYQKLLANEYGKPKKKSKKSKKSKESKIKSNQYANIKKKIRSGKIKKLILLKKIPIDPIKSYKANLTKRIKAYNKFIGKLNLDIGKYNKKNPRNKFETQNRITKQMHEKYINLR